jgi:hypothetical protein
MRIIPDQLRSKNLVPFKKRRGRYKIPGMTAENEALMDRVDPDLNQEEQSYVRHYLGYADTFIRMTEENALAELAEADLPEGAPPNNEERPQQLPATQSRVRLVEEPGPAETNDHPARAA